LGSLSGSGNRSDEFESTNVVVSGSCIDSIIGSSVGSTTGSSNPTA